MRGETWRTFVLTGDGELQDRLNWEAAMSARQYELENLTLIVDLNGLQQEDFTENTIRMNPLGAKWKAFGFAVEEVNGNDTAAFRNVFRRAAPEPRKPRCVIAHTVNGNGVTFAENQPSWHHGVLTEEQLLLAAAELNAESAWRAPVRPWSGELGSRRRLLRS
jgi:transketolase